MTEIITRVVTWLKRQYPLPVPAVVEVEVVPLAVPAVVEVSH